jgi:hypothetical protein
LPKTINNRSPYVCRLSNIGTSICTRSQICVFTFLVLCSDLRSKFRIKTIFACIYLQLFVGDLMSYLCYLCLLVHSGIQHVLTMRVACCCSIRGRNCLPFMSTWIHPQFLEGSILLIFSNFCVVFLCLFSSCVLCTQYSQYLWIVHS